MKPDSQPLTATERADLVAYLDGELPVDQSRAVVTRLTHDPSARREVEALEKSWDLLEYLQRPRASVELTTRTLTLARLEPAEPSSTATMPGSAGVRRGLWSALGLAALAIAAFALGHAAARRLPPDPTARLAHELSLAENLDAYQRAGSLEFLRRIAPAFADSEEAP